MAMMGSGAAERRGPRARRPPRRPSRARCSRTSTSPARTASWSTSPPAWTCRSGSSRRSATSSSSSPPRTRPSWSARSSIRSMANQMRVTVVATGLGKPAARARAPQPRAAPSDARAASAAQPTDARGATRVTAWRRPTTPMLDKPTVQRQRAVGDGLRPETRVRGSAGYPGVSAPAGRLMRHGRRHAAPRRAADRSRAVRRAAVPDSQRRCMVRRVCGTLAAVNVGSRTVHRC